MSFPETLTEAVIGAGAEAEVTGEGDVLLPLPPPPHADSANDVRPIKQNLKRFTILPLRRDVRGTKQGRCQSAATVKNHHQIGDNSWAYAISVIFFGGVEGEFLKLNLI